MNKILQNIEKCTGCHSCELVCPKNCIKLYKDKEGFLLPNIDKNKCINCHICEKHCHMLIENKTDLIYQKKELSACFGWILDENIRKNSSSGGAFSAIVESFLRENDIIFGAVYNESRDYVYCTFSNKKNYSTMRKSKYVFSDLNQCFETAKIFLKNGKRVLFTGTPCQIGGLKAYLREEYTNLLTLDIICHGTPSIDLLNDHLEHISGKMILKDIDFRSSDFGWVSYGLSVIFEKNSKENKYIKRYDKDFYMDNFLKNNNLRKCCYSCQYSNKNHVSDITIADFWGIFDYKPELNDQKGISLIIFNNKKICTQLKSLLSNYMYLEDLEYNNYSYVFKSHDGYSKIKRAEFMKKYTRQGYKRTYINWYFSHSIKRSKIKIKKLLFNKNKGI